jgi:hypothetical protein
MKPYYNKDMAFDFKIFIIGEIDSVRSLPLRKSLLALDQKIEFIHPVRIKGDERFVGPSQDQIKIFRYLYGRELLLEEIACAMAHNIARKKASELNSISLILEDDARLSVSIEKLITTAEKFAQLKNSTMSLLNVAGEMGTGRKLDEEVVPKILRNFGPSSTAVAYFLGSGASDYLYQENNPVKFLADWPPMNIPTYSTHIPIFEHGDYSTVSTIEIGNFRIDNGLSLYQKIAIYFGFYGILRKSDFPLSFFLQSLFIPRLKFRADNLLFRIRRLFNYV